MPNAPIIELHLRDLGIEMCAAFMAHQEDISQQVEDGIHMAVQRAAPLVAEKAADEAGKRIDDAIRNYFGYGPGRKLIDAAVEKAMAQVTEALSKV